MPASDRYQMVRTLYWCLRYSGGPRPYTRLAQHYYWKGMQVDVTDCVTLYKEMLPGSGVMSYFFWITKYLVPANSWLWGHVQ